MLAGPGDARPSRWSRSVPGATGPGSGLTHWLAIGCRALLEAEAEPFVQAERPGRVLRVDAERGLVHAPPVELDEGRRDQCPPTPRRRHGRRTLTRSSQPRRIPAASLSAG